MLNDRLQAAIDSGGEILETIEAVKGADYLRVLTFMINTHQLATLASYLGDDEELTRAVTAISYDLTRQYMKAVGFTPTREEYDEMLNTIRALRARFTGALE